MATPILPQDLNGMASNVQVIYKTMPFYLTWQFALAVLLFIGIIIISLYAYFRISMRNRTVVIIHMPDKTRQVYSYKYFNGNRFEIYGFEKDKDGQRIKNIYNFKSEAVETGYFGRYIEYDYGDSEPRIFKHSKNELDYVFISSLLNTQLAVDLLLSSKFKEFVKMMLIIIAVGILLNLIINGYNAYTLYNIAGKKGIQSCSLELTNQTVETWKTLQAIR